MSRLVLASGSRYRAELLKRLEVPFSAVSPPFDERAEDDRFHELGPERFALYLARGKAESVVGSHGDGHVLAADQIAVHDQILLHKPGSTTAAIAQLMRLSGTTHQLITGVCLRLPSAEVLEHVDVHRLTMRDFSRREASDYVHKYLPLDCVGSYRIEDAGIKLFERLVGEDQTGIVGLPLIAVAKMFRRAGLLPTPDASDATP